MPTTRLDERLKEIADEYAERGAEVAHQLHQAYPDLGLGTVYLRDPESPRRMNHVVSDVQSRQGDPKAECESSSSTSA